MAEILIAEDTAAIRGMLEKLLRYHGFETCAVSDGEAALTKWRERHPDLLLLDIMMPRRSGYEVLTEVRKVDKHIPVLFLSAKGADDDVVLGLGLGADDYISKPFEPQVLVARVNALLRRASSVAAANRLRVGSCLLDESRQCLVAASGMELQLRATETRLMSLFMKHPDEVITRDVILDEAWGRDAGSIHSLDQTVSVLRRKISDSGVCIETVYGVGYRLRAR